MAQEGAYGDPAVLRSGDVLSFSLLTAATLPVEG